MLPIALWVSPAVNVSKRYCPYCAIPPPRGEILQISRQNKNWQFVISFLSNKNYFSLLMQAVSMRKLHSRSNVYDDSAAISRSLCTKADDDCSAKNVPNANFSQQTLVFKLVQGGPPIIRDVCLHKGWRENCSDIEGDAADYNLWWKNNRFTASEIEEANTSKLNKRLNHIPHSSLLTRKVRINNATCVAF